MFALYFHWEDCAPVMRFGDRLPAVGESVTLPEFGGEANPLEIIRVTSKERRSVSIVLQRDRLLSAALQNSTTPPTHG